MTTTPQIKTPLPGPRAKAIIDRDKAVVSPSYTRGYPLVIARGEGAMVEDVDGNVFLDCAAGIAVNSTGHSHPEVVQAITDQAQKFLHMSGTDFYYEPQVRLAEEMAAISPIRGGVRTFFGNSGTEAVEACLKLSRYATGRSNIIAFLGGFHGRTMGSLALTSSKAIQRRGFGPLMPGVYHAPFADCYRCPLGLSSTNCAAECLDFIDEQIFAHLVSPDEVAAIVVEPIQGEGGYLVAPDQFLQRLRELTTRHGILFVADEVQSGMGRSGKMFAIEYSGVEPDMMAIAKGIASGMPLGVAVARSGLMAWPPGAHASTFGGNPVSCAAALATIKLLKERLVANAGEVGAHLMNGLKALMERHPLIGDVRGRALMIGVELVRDRRTKERASDERDAVVQAAFARGLLLLGAGKNAIRFSPPLVLTREQADMAARIFDEALTEVERSRR
ncbi:MAG TPA: acetyl ornithine aminotransferase family protein [Vicinamibacterales bacterium]|jgi:4-aminobutyrate aminotransferase|nr:acetyl ornithine aminotransferase family protein [Vicinamibacterales bacterium]